MSTLVPPLFEGLVDDASMFPPGSASASEALAAHRPAPHRLVRRLRRPAARAGFGAAEARRPDLRARRHRRCRLPRIGLIGDTGVAALPAALDRARAAGFTVTPGRGGGRQARRGPAARPGCRSAARRRAPRAGHLRRDPADLGSARRTGRHRPQDRAAGRRIAPKFRTGGLAAELFPTPVELAAVICACRDRDLPFKLTAGLHHAVRHTDPETGFTHHGFLNVLVATALAVEDGEVAEVAEALGATHPTSLIEPVRRPAFRSAPALGRLRHVQRPGTAHRPDPVRPDQRGIRVSQPSASPLDVPETRCTGRRTCRTGCSAPAVGGAGSASASAISSSTWTVRRPPT